MSETVEVICLLAATFVQCWNTIMKKIPKTTDKICLDETESEASFQESQTAKQE